jgi:membrane protein implicated in regulation of membrane protease activity
VARSLNLYVLLTFLFYFGVTGMLMSVHAQRPVIVTLAVPALIGATAAMACSAVLGRLFGDTSGVVTSENSRLEGREVKVSRTIRPGGTGEVISMPRGGVTQNIPARSMDGQRIPAGQTVVVVAVRQGIALVERLDLLSEVDGSEDAANSEDD